MRLLTNNPTKRAGLEGFGLEIVELVPLEVHATPENLRYLQTKRDRMGHDLSGLPPVGAAPRSVRDDSAVPVPANPISSQDTAPPHVAIPPLEALATVALPDIAAAETGSL
jgi:hypothetical protein